MSYHQQSRASRKRDIYADRLQKRRHALSSGRLAVAEFIDGHRHAVLGMSALDIAKETNTSDATVIRAIQMLGFDGLVDLKDTLEAYLGATDSPVEKMSTTTSDLGIDTDAALDFVIADQAAAAAQMGSPENRKSFAEAVSLLAGARGIGVFGIGASGLIATYASRLFMRSGFRAYALDRTGIMLAEQLIQIERGDVLLMLLHGRPHREAMATITEGKRLSASIIMVLGKSESVLLRHASVALVIGRSKRENVALHAPAVTCVEALALGVASRTRTRTLETLDRILDIRQQIRSSKG